MNYSHLDPVAPLASLSGVEEADRQHGPLECNCREQKVETCREMGGHGGNRGRTMSGTSETCRDLARGTVKHTPYTSIHRCKIILSMWC